jgi:hypothetical protein
MDSKVYHSFGFIVSLCVLCPLLNQLVLNFRTEVVIIIIKAYSKVEEVIDELSALRESNAMLRSWYVEAARKVNVEPEVPRTTSRQQHRDNVEHSSAEQYYRRTIVLPLLDHLIQQMKETFGRINSDVSGETNSSCAICMFYA